MEQKPHSAPNTCRKCGRALEDFEKFGLCADCKNKYGSPLAAVAGLAVVGAVKKLGPIAFRAVKTLIKR